MEPVLMRNYASDVNSLAESEKRYYSVADVCAMLGTYVHDRDREDDCPLVPVPPHGDLIDRDPFIEFIKTHWDSYDQWFVEQLEARPTIVPPEEGET